MRRGPKKPRQRPGRLVPKRPPTEAERKSREALRKYSWKKGQSGNPRGSDSARQTSLAEGVRICRTLVMDDAVIEHMQAILLDKRNPKLALEAFRILMERAFGLPPQMIALQSQISIDDARRTRAFLPTAAAVRP